MHDQVLITIIVAIAFVGGFYVGLQCKSDLLYSEDTDLLDLFDHEHIDLDIYTGRGTEGVKFKVYHPTKQFAYDSPTFPNARDALRDFAEKNARADHQG